MTRKRKQRPAPEKEKGRAEGSAEQRETLDIPQTMVLAVRYHQNGRLAEAEQLYQHVLEADPNFPPVYINLGVLFKAQGRMDEATAAYRKSIELNPKSETAHNNLGNVLSDQGRLDEAIAAYRKAVSIKPNYAEAYNNLGNALRGRGLPDEAFAAYQKAIAFKPRFAEAHNNLGNFFREQGKIEEALAAYEKAVEIRPNSPEALGTLLREKQDICQWQGLDGLGQHVTGLVQQGVGAIPPFVLLTLPTTPEQQSQCARQWTQLKMRPWVRQAKKLNFQHRKTSGNKLRIGYLSVDFRRHAVMQSIAGIFERHDRDRFEIVAYSYGPDDKSEMRGRLVAAFDRFVDIQRTPLIEAARLINHDAVDILVDLSGYTKHSRTEILAMRPAPIQVSYVGFPGTMGADFFDYVVVDPFVVPAEQQRYYAEKIVHLPDCYLANDDTREISSQTPSRAECGLPEQGMVFCCFNNTYKIQRPLFDAWMRLIEAVEGSVLWLFAPNPYAEKNLKQEADRRNVDPARLVFAQLRDFSDYLAQYRIADLFLDTTPYNAGATAADALWAGCPVLTCAGETYVSRFACSMLNAVGLPELVTNSLEDYEAAALRLAQNPEELRDIRERLRENARKMPLFDCDRFTRRLETAYMAMWAVYKKGKPPHPFAVDAEGSHPIDYTRTETSSETDETQS
jgi:predicted O-linked N-acetylglucosamine transferase (SPINDLY family)